MIEPLLLTSTRVVTFAGDDALTNGSGFFFARGARLFFVTSKHVLADEPSGHAPDRIQIELHTDFDNLAESIGFSIPLFRGNERVWRREIDSAGEIDIAIVELDRAAMPDSAVYSVFTPENLLDAGSPQPQIGSALLVVGFPLGFHDQLHHMPVVRQAAIASSYGWRFEGKGYFLTDARTHRGSSGAPVVMSASQGYAAPAALPWKLLGVHSARLDVGSRDQELDEALGLNCAWYADVLLSLTDH